MRRVEALNLNNILAELKISGENIDQTTKMNIIKTKLQLSMIAEGFYVHRAALEKECDKDEMTLRSLLEEYFMEKIEFKPYPISIGGMNELINKNELKISDIELFYKYLVQQEDGNFEFNNN